MKTRSAKAKGRKLQNFVRDLLRSNFSHILEDDDIKGAVMGESGEDIKLSPLAKQVIPYSFECKAQEKVNIWSTMKQAEENAEDRVPVGVIKRNRSKTFAVIEIDEFVKLIRSKENAKDRLNG